MAIIKSHTDLPKSKKLAKILPITSIDFAWCIFSNGSTRLLPMDDWEVFEYAKSNMEIIPCFSLAALLNEIPEVINFNDDENDYALKILKENGLYYLSYDNPLEHGKIEIEPQENFIDAGYEMIIKLHELNLL